jgi:hypothetical protein
MKPWIRTRADKKDVAPNVQPVEFGKSFTKWWTAIQPSWRRSMVDGTLSKDTPDDEKWGGLMKGGTAGIYTVVVALSWWIKALGTIADGGDASVALRDVTWVLDQVCGTLLTKQGSSGLKRGCGHDDLSEGTQRKKRCVSISFSRCFRFLIISVIRLRSST